MQATNRRAIIAGARNLVSDAYYQAYLHYRS